MSDYIVPNEKNRSFLDSISQRYTYEHKVFPEYSKKIIKSNSLTFEFYDRSDKLPINNNNQGVYLLYTVYEDFLLMYIGKSRDVEERQKQHSKNMEKDVLKHAIVITKASNGFSESDISNLENALYLDFKRRSKIILYNDNIPSKDKYYDVEETYVLEWVMCISNISLTYVVGQKLQEYQHFDSTVETTKYFYNLIQNGLSNIRLYKNPRHQTGYILKGSILAINQKLHIDKRQTLEKFVEENKNCFKEQESINNHKIYLFVETKRVHTSILQTLFNKTSQYYFMDYDGHINKLKL